MGVETPHSFPYLLTTSASGTKRWLFRFFARCWGKSLNLNTTKERLRGDPAASALIDLIEKNEAYLDLTDSSVYYKFPIYKDNDNIITAKLIIVAPQRGVFVISTTITDDPANHEAIEAADEELDTVYGQLHARFTKQKTLRRDKKNLSFPLEPMIFAPYLNVVPTTDVETDLVTDRAGFSEFLNRHAGSTIDPETVREICSVIEGAKGLVLPRPRPVVGLPQSARAAQVNALEAEIRSFDQDQKRGYMEVLRGPQRIRGLAGSGKTVVLAMKAAITHLQNPDATIAYTFIPEVFINMFVDLLLDSIGNTTIEILTGINYRSSMPGVAAVRLACTITHVSTMG